LSTSRKIITMSAMKKPSSKPAAKSPAPATQATPAPAAAPVVKPAKAAKPAPAPAPAPIAAKPVVTTKPVVAPKPAAKKKAPAKRAAAVPAAPVPVEAVAAPVAPIVPVAPPAPAAVTPVASAPVVTTITAQIDIGFGNALYIRGEGAGLSWDVGTLMTCVNDDQWQITVGESARPIVFKFLVNDLSWSAGADYTILAGGSAVLTPTF
jgi:hypothetical protein